jgi:DNA-binding MarR family transcriptional regulator
MALGYSPQTITDALERDGLITRSPDPSDRRAKTLTLTESDSRHLAAAKVVRDQVRAHILASSAMRSEASCKPCYNGCA